jgi:hypothetical protein
VTTFHCRRRRRKASPCRSIGGRIAVELLETRALPSIAIPGALFATPSYIAIPIGHHPAGTAPAPTGQPPTSSLPAGPVPGTGQGQPPRLTPYGAAPPGSPDNNQGSFNGSFAPSDIQTAYAIAPLIKNGNDGTGETIAVVDAYDNSGLVSSSRSSYSNSDLAKFDKQFGLPDPTFLKVDENGGHSYPSRNNQWALESSLDVEWAHALAPKATIILVECASASTDDLFKGVDWAATPVAKGGGGASAVSMSFGADGGFSGENTLDSAFDPAAFPGVTFLASAGDSGSVNNQAGYPADSPDVVAVGGTNLTVVGGGNYSYQSESAWDSTGGGISNYESQPAYQAGLVIHDGSNTVDPKGMRAAPDIALVADPNSGVAVYSSANGTWFQVGGTSVSAPCWAALVALADQVRSNAGLPSLTGATVTLPNLYQMATNSTVYANDFHDIKSGGNGTWNAGTAYDLVTGLGTPVAQNLVPDLAGAVVTNVTSTAANGTYSQGAVLPIPVTFDVPVTVTGMPQLALNSGGTASYAGGSGTSTLTFNYVVGANDHSTHLDFSGTGSLTLNGGTISVNGSSPAEPADLALMATGSTGSLGANKNIVIVAATTTTVTTSNANPSAVANTTVTLTATVAGAGGTATGTVQFYDNLLPLGGTVTLSSGVASITASTALLQATNGLTPGLHSITAVYAPDSASQNAFAASFGVYEQSVQGQPFAPGDQLVERVGDGTTPLLNEPSTGPHGGKASVGDTIYLDEYTPGGTLVQSLALPTADGTGTQSTIKAVVADGQQAGTGQLTLSGDGQDLFLTGYDSSLNPANLAAAPELHYSSTTPRAAARVRYDGTIQTLGFTAGSGGVETGGNIDGVYSPDGNQFYVSGANGVYYGSSFVPSATLQSPALVTGTSYETTGLEGVGANLYAAGVPYGSANLVGAYGVFPTAGAAAISAATETGNTVAVTTSAASGFQAGEAVSIAGLTPSGYDGTFTITQILDATDFTYTDPAGGLASGSGSSATATPVPGPLPGLPGPDTNTNPIDVYLAQLNGNGAPAGINTMYVADTGGSSTGAQITKWALSGGAWSLVDTVTAGTGNSAVGFYWLSGKTDNSGNVTLYATYGNGGTSVTGPGDLYSISDTNGYDAPIGSGGAHSDAVTTVASVGSSSNEVFRGASAAPVMAVTSVTVNANTFPIISATESGNTVTVTTNGTHGFVPGQSIVVAGVSVVGYNGVFTVASVSDATHFTYTDSNAGLGNAALGTATSAQAASAAVSTATSSGTTATITTAAANGFTAGQVVTISGVSVSGYNGIFTIANIVDATDFTYTTAGSNLNSGSGGTAALNSLLSGAQRSMVDSITYTFSQPVTLGANAFSVAVHGTSAISSATESGNTVTITTAATQLFFSGQTITIAGVSVAGYNGTFPITTVDSSTFTYTDPISGLGGGSGGTAGPGTAPGVSYLSPDGGITWVVTFTGASVIGNSINDGVYDITLNQSAVTFNSSGATLAQSNRTLDTLYRLYGDTVGHERVNATDYSLFVGAFGSRSGQASYVVFLDFDGNGRINAVDYSAFVSNFARRYSGFSPSI